MKNKILGLLAAGLLAGPMSANAVMVFDFEGTCNTDGCPALSSSASGVLTLADSYVFGTAFTSSDLISFDYTSADIHLFFAPGDSNFSLQGGGGINADGSLVNVIDIADDDGSFFADVLGWVAIVPPTPGSEDEDPDIDQGTIYSFTLRPSAVPEPGTLGLLGLGLLGLGLTRRKAN
jgi:hypothetical protein